MKFTDEDYKYLNGEKFSSGYNFVLQNNPLYDRILLLKQLLSGKSVLHIGCCDHLPLIDEKIKKNKWLQKILDDSCRYVTGVDINKEAVDYINEHKLSKNPVYCADITDKSFSKIVPKDNFDFVLLGEILEHVDNPVDFLKCMKRRMDEYGFEGRYIITVPNAFCLQKGIYRKGTEFVNSDHKFWFTPYTLAKVLTDAGIKPQELYFANNGRGGNGKNRIEQMFFVNLERLRRKPSSCKSFRGGILVIIGM